MQLLRYTRWGGAMVDAATAASYGYSPIEVARNKVETLDRSDQPNQERVAQLARVHQYFCQTGGLSSHGYR